MQIMLMILMPMILRKNWEQMTKPGLSKKLILYLNIPKQWEKVTMIYLALWRRKEWKSYFYQPWVSEQETGEFSLYWDPALSLWDFHRPFPAQIMTDMSQKTRSGEHWLKCGQKTQLPATVHLTGAVGILDVHDFVFILMDHRRSFTDKKQTHESFKNVGFFCILLGNNFEKNLFCSKSYIFRSPP